MRRILNMNCENSLRVVAGSRIVSPLAKVRKSNIPALSRKVLSLVRCRVLRKFIGSVLKQVFTFAEVLYASSGEGLFRRGVVGYGGHGYGTRFAAFRISTSGKWVVSVLLGEDSDFC